VSTLKGLSAKLEKLPGRVVADATAQFVAIAEASAARALHGTNVMNMHVRRRGAATGSRNPRTIPVRMTVRVKLHGEAAQAWAYLHAFPPGPWAWIESGTTAHLIGKGKIRGRGLKRKMAAQYVMGGGFDHPVRGPVLHPGSRGKQAWTRAVVEFHAQARVAAVKALKEALDG
jgi:hypothetical protein